MNDTKKLGKRDISKESRKDKKKRKSYVYVGDVGSLIQRIIAVSRKIVDSHIQRIVAAAEETIVTQNESAIDYHITCQSRSWLQGEIRVLLNNL